MLYFANPSTEPVRDAMRSGLLGSIHTPKQGNRMVSGAVWCADNGCYGKGWPGESRWIQWLASAVEHRATCAFATAPDVVGHGRASLKRSRPWLPVLRAMGYQAALVAQDGLERLAVPWDEFDVLFIGGTTGWKVGPAARALTVEAKRRGKNVHMGRVNSERRYAYAELIGCDSADGTYIAFGPDRNLPNVARWASSLFGEAS